MTTSVVQTETAAAGELVLRVGVAQETGKPPKEPPGVPPGVPPGEPPGGAVALESVELESEDKPATTDPSGDPPGGLPGEPPGRVSAARPGHPAPGT